MHREEEADPTKHAQARCRPISVNKRIDADPAEHARCVRHTNPSFILGEYTVGIRNHPRHWPMQRRMDGTYNHFPRKTCFGTPPNEVSGHARKH